MKSSIIPIETMSAHPAESRKRRVSRFSCHYGKVDITPEGPVWLAGFANRHEPSSGIHRRLFSACLAIKDFSDVCCIIANDLLELSVDDVAAIRDEIVRETPLTADRIFIHSIHTHAAPTLSAVQLALPEHEANRRYHDQVLKKIAANAIWTVNYLSDYRDCRLMAGQGVGHLGICRRPGAVVPTPAEDPGIPLVVIEFEDVTTGQPYVTMINYACHPVVLYADNRAVSSDYVGAAREYLETVRRDRVMFLNGAAGDIDPRPPLGHDPAVADAAGIALGHEAAAIPLREIVADGLTVAMAEVELPFQYPAQTAAFLDAEVQRKTMEKTDFTDWTEHLRHWGEYMKNKLAREGLPAGRKTRIGALKIGDVVWFFSQGEIFSGYQDLIRAEFPNRIISFSGYTNGKTGYLPDAAAFAAGGYEVEQAYVYVYEPSPIDPQACTVFAAAAKKLISTILNLNPNYQQE